MTFVTHILSISFRKSQLSVAVSECIIDLLYIHKLDYSIIVYNRKYHINILCLYILF